MQQMRRDSTSATRGSEVRSLGSFAEGRFGALQIFVVYVCCLAVVLRDVLSSCRRRTC